MYPIINDVPILINENKSIFSYEDFINKHNTTFYSSRNKLEQAIIKFLPGISRNIKGRENYEKLAKLLRGQSNAPKVLVIGGSIVGAGMEALTMHPGIELIESDVTFGPRTDLICDAHNISFVDNSFDGVIVQAVLEHVVDP